MSKSIAWRIGQVKMVGEKKLRLVFYHSYFAEGGSVKAKYLAMVAYHYSKAIPKLVPAKAGAAFEAATQPSFEFG